MWSAASACLLQRCVLNVFGSTQNLISSLAKAETLRRAANKHMRFGQEMVCKVADVYTLYWDVLGLLFFFFFSTQLNQAFII